MAMFILLAESQADHVAGPSLEPVERQGGIFILSARVLVDPTHAEYREYLAALPQMDSANPDFPPEIPCDP